MNTNGAAVLEETGWSVGEELGHLVRSAGNPYIFISLVDPESGQVELVTQGFTPEQVARGLREAADQLTTQLMEAQTNPL